MSFLWFLVIGIVAGWLAGLIMKGHGFGMVGDMVVGIIGALIGGLLFNLFGLGAYGTSGALIMSVIGAVVFLALIGTVRRA